MLDLISKERLVLYVIFISLVFFPVIHDPDYFFHLVAGEYIIGHATLPHVDVFSYSNPGKPWVMHEWLFEVVIYYIHLVGGDLGVKLVAASIIIAIISNTLRCAPTNTRYAAIIVPLTITALLAPFITPRPQLFTYLFFSFYLFSLFRCHFDHDCRHLKWLPFIMIGWTNMHGGYIIGLIIISLFLAIEIHKENTNDRENKPCIKHLTITLAATIIASSINPYFIYHWLFPFQLIGADYIKFISEWQRPDFGKIYFKIYLAFIVIYLIILLNSLRSKFLASNLTPIPFIIASFLSARHIPLAIIITLPFWLLQSSAIKKSNYLTRAFAHPKLSPTIFRKELGNIEYFLNATILLILIVCAVTLYPLFHSHDDNVINRYLPVNATNFIEQQNIKGNMFNTYRYGGYLLHRLYPEQKVFIDIRADMYGADFIGKYETLLFAKNGWLKLVDDYNIAYFICDKFTPIARALREHSEFTVLYEDSLSIVAIKN